MTSIFFSLSSPKIFLASSIAIELIERGLYPTFVSVRILFRHIECFMEDLIQEEPCGVMKPGNPVSVFDLPQDFRFSYDKGIKAGGDEKQVLAGVLIVEGIGIIVQPFRLYSEMFLKVFFLSLQEMLREGENGNIFLFCCR